MSSVNRIRILVSLILIVALLFGTSAQIFAAQNQPMPNVPMSYDVIYHSNTSNDVIVRDGGNAAMKQVTVRDFDYLNCDTESEFLGWSNEPRGAIKYMKGDTFDMPTKEVHLYAIYKESRGKVSTIVSRFLTNDLRNKYFCRSKIRRHQCGTGSS